MDIEQAIRYTTGKLTLGEKSLANDLLYSEQYHAVGETVWLRAPVLNLGNAVQRARSQAAAQGFRASFINVFCDTLVVDKGLRIGPEKDKYFVMEIFARAVRFDSSEALHLDMVKDSEVLFWTMSFPQDLRLDINVKDGLQTTCIPVIERDQFGIALRCEEPSKGIVTEQYSAPVSAMENINYLDLIDETGKVKSRGVRNDDLPRLLQMQLLVAQAHLTLNRPLAVSLLTYISAATATPSSIYFNYQANALLNNLIMEADVTAVSSINVYASKQVLKSRLVAALAFEQAFNEFLGQASNTKLQAMNAMNLLAKSDDAFAVYAFLRDLKQRAYDSAVVANEKANKVFLENQADLVTLSGRFDKGVEAFKRKQKTDAAWDVFKDIVAVGIAIGATVATAGATAPTALAAGATVVNTGTKIAQLIAKLKKIYEALKKLYDKIKPMLEKLREVVKTIDTLIKSLRQLDEKTAGPKSLKPEAKSTDVYNATAEWKRFNITVLEMEASLRDYEIDGKPEYFHALKTMVVNGECYILTQANLVQKGDELATTLVQQRMETRDRDRLAKSVTIVETDLNIINILSRAMFDRLLAIRSLVFLDFMSYSSAYQYHTLSAHPPIVLSPVKPIVDYLQDAAVLQGAIVSFGSRAMVQQRSFSMDTLCGFKSAKELGEQLMQTGQVRLSISPGEEIFKGFSRIRMSTARCYLNGVKATSGAPSLPGSYLRLILKTSGQFFDLDTPIALASHSPHVRSFVGDSRDLVFEYDTRDRAVVCDGLYGQLRDYTKHSPMTHWTVCLCDGPGAVKVRDLDFSGFTGIRMEFVCEFTWTGMLELGLALPEPAGHVGQIGASVNGEEHEDAEDDKGN